MNAEKKINQVTAREKWQSYLRHPMALVQFLLVHLAALITAAVVLFLIAYVLITGVPHIHKELFAWTWTTENQSMMPALVNTLVMTLLSLLIAVPIGVCAAIYMVEYAKRGNKLVKLVRLTAETLQGGAASGLFHAVRCADPFDYDPAPDPPNHGGSADGGAGFLPGGQLRTGCR